MADAPLTPEREFIRQMRIGREVFVIPVVRRDGGTYGDGTCQRLVVCGVSCADGTWSVELRAPTEEERGA